MKHALQQMQYRSAVMYEMLSNMYYIPLYFSTWSRDMESRPCGSRAQFSGITSKLPVSCTSDNLNLKGIKNIQWIKKR